MVFFFSSHYASIHLFSFLLVVKLFNAIQQSQNTVAEAAEEAKAAKGSGKPRLPAPTFDDRGNKKGKKRDNVVGRGKESK